ncbi:helix-turn-helix domain-containing protein [Paenibacillus sp. YN15]|uniref:helix-turn-helix domain-containing protein n=1 Tax=Paenibacillus sp. YN15 TaxID=1742774 RepID=UPI000DCCC8BB|nr:helix-turn-helix domain-containing protein [Paenibacillus sp. YN15]RAV04639.1 hypothetical protein DQG13_05340 [Paenibacillus sp. YN15]
MKTSITGRIMLIYGGVLLAIISLTFLLSYVGTVTSLRNQLVETNFALLKQIDQKMELSFQQIDKDLLQLTNELEFVYYMNNIYDNDVQKYTNFYGLNEKLEKFMARNPQFSSIYVYSDVSGYILTQKTFMNKDVSENKWLGDYLNMKGYSQWLPTHQIWDGVSFSDVVTLIRAYPALSRPGLRTGLLAVNMNESMLYRMIDDIYEKGNKGETFLINDEGRVITHNDKSRLHSNVKEMPFIKKVLNGGASGSFDISLDRQKQTVFYSTTSSTGWKIVSIVPKSQVYRSIAVIRNLLLVFTAVMFLIAFVLLFYVSRRTFRPMDRVLGKFARQYKPARRSMPDRPAEKGLSYLENLFDEMYEDRESLAHQVRESKPMLKWRIVMDMLTGHRTDYPLVKHQLEFTGTRLYPEWFVVASAEIGKEGGIALKDEALYTYALCNVAEELINMENAGAAIDLGGGRAVILFSFAEGDEVQNQLRAATVLEQILDIMLKQFGLTVAAGVGRCCREMTQIPVSYADSLQALQYKMLTGPHSVMSIDDIQTWESQDYYGFAQRIDSILEALKQGDSPKLKQLLAEAFQNAVKIALSPDLLRQFSFELVMRAVQTMESVGIDTEELRTGNGNLYERIQQCENYRQTEQLVGDFILKLSAALEHRRSQRGKNDVINGIIAYIQEHYQDSGLSLDRLAGEFDLNPTYISRLFKEYAESNFIDYLIEIRIQAAKELLKNKSIKISDISNEVGYNNSRSFMRTFKKYTGLTPTEYREQVTDQEKEGEN